MVDYINKQDCECLGFIRLQDGTLYRQSVLEKYKSKGWLSFGDSRYSEDDRMKAGCRKPGSGIMTEKSKSALSSFFLMMSTKWRRISGSGKLLAKTRRPGRAGTFNRCEGNKICPRQFESVRRAADDVQGHLVRRAPAI